MSKPILPPDDPPPAAEYGQRRAYCARLGISQAQFEVMFGTQANPKSRKDGATACAVWAHDLPKAKEKSK